MKFKRTAMSLAYGNTCCFGFWYRGQQVSFPYRMHMVDQYTSITDFWGFVVVSSISTDNYSALTYILYRVCSKINVRLFHPAWKKKIWLHVLQEKFIASITPDQLIRQNKTKTSDISCFLDSCLVIKSCTGKSSASCKAQLTNRAHISKRPVEAKQLLLSFSSLLF